LWQDSEYNLASATINELFLGTDRMFVVVRGEKENVLKEPDLLQHINDFQHFIELQPEIGGSVALPDVIPVINSVLHEGNPAYQTWGDNTGQNAELLYMYLTGSDPGDLASFCDQYYKNGAITMYFRDHKGETIRTAISRIKHFIQNNPLEHAEYELAGGYIGVLAAVNEVIFAGQIESIAFALLVVLITCSVTYRSGVAGLYFMLPIIISNVLTFNYMVAKGIGLNINTLPVAALGIGLGVDYAIYVMDALKEHYSRYKNLDDAVFFALRTAGRGVLNTATPLILCTGLWYFFSPMRFQAEMAILIAIWMGISATCALIYMPALVYVVRPGFLLGNGEAEK
jgi:predicted RND superfamily exporter protein